MSWETWQDAGAGQKFDDLDDDEEKGNLLECDDWEEWSEKEEEEPPEAEPGDPGALALAAGAPKPKPKPKAKKVRAKEKEKKKKDTEEELDPETRRRRDLMRQKVNAFDAASSLMGDVGDSKKVPVSLLKPTDAAEYANFAAAITDVITTYEDHSKYVEFLLSILKNVKELAKHEPLERLSKTVAVMYNERLREEKAGPGEERKHTKRVGPKKDLMDAALDGRNRAALDVDDDFM
eukprot:EG_transcript_18435